MKVCIKVVKSGVSKEQMEVISSFIKFLQSQLPLSSDVEIKFIDDQNQTGTTGVRMPGGKINVLAKGRMLVDILRTLSHEWVHEYQTQEMGVDEKEKIQDIGGPEENMSNVLSGIFIKKFDKQNPDFKERLYEDKKVVSLRRKKNPIDDEIEEIERTVEDLSRNFGVETSVKDIVRAFRNGVEIKIPFEVWSKLENTHSNKIKVGEMDKVRKIAKEFNKTNPTKLSKALMSGVYDRPMILKFGDRYYLVAGNTRLSTAAALGMTPMVLIGELKNY
jgi:hypothetical protein